MKNVLLGCVLSLTAAPSVSDQQIVQTVQNEPVASCESGECNIQLLQKVVDNQPVRSTIKNVVDVKPVRTAVSYTRSAVCKQVSRRPVRRFFPRLRCR